MVCKEDVVSWFKELESYKRIDAMCTLLNMCLPFELRFIGTYLEELGKRDFQELRGAELRANNPTDLAADIGGANTDPRTRRKMVLYVSLLRSCNFPCATTLYNVMVSLEQSGHLKSLLGDILEEILLLYTMALHHPAFTFDQKSHFGEILESLKGEEQRVQQYHTECQDQITPSPCVSHSSIPPNLSVPPPNMAGLTPPPGLVYVKPTPLPAVSGTEQVQDIGASPIMPVLAEVHHPPPGIPLPQYSLPDYVLGQTPWPPGMIVPNMNSPLEMLNFGGVSEGSAGGAGAGTGVGGASSPGMSPAGSRAATPPRRRPSPSPPPPSTHLQLQPLTLSFENLAIRRLEEERLREAGAGPGAAAAAAAAAAAGRAVEKLNGVVRRASHCYPAPPPAPPPPPRSSASTSPSPASTPPSTPAPPPRHLLPPAPVAPAPSQVPPFPYLPYPRPFAAYPAPPFRPPPPPFANGEASAYGAQYGGYVPVLFAGPKVSCWNCGGGGHAGHECKEPSMEEMTRAGGYQLDFGAPHPPHPDPPDPK